MTPAEIDLLKSHIDKVLLIETTQGYRFLAQILVVFDEGPTPDVFFLEVEPGPNGTFLQRENAGHSILLSDIRAVLPPTTQT